MKKETKQGFKEAEQGSKEVKQGFKEAPQGGEERKKKPPAACVKVGVAPAHKR